MRYACDECVMDGVLHRVRDCLFSLVGPTLGRIGIVKTTRALPLCANYFTLARFPISQETQMLSLFDWNDLLV